MPEITKLMSIAYSDENYAGKETFENHTIDTNVHVSSNEKEVWGNKQDALTPGTGISIENNTISLSAPVPIELEKKQPTALLQFEFKDEPPIFSILDYYTLGGVITAQVVGCSSPEIRYLSKENLQDWLRYLSGKGSGYIYSIVNKGDLYALEITKHKDYYPNLITVMPEEAYPFKDCFEESTRTYNMPSYTGILSHNAIYKVTVDEDVDLSGLLVEKYGTCELWVDYTTGSVRWPDNWSWVDNIEPGDLTPGRYFFRLKNDGVTVIARKEMSYAD